MGKIGRLIDDLEARIVEPAEERRRREYRDFLVRLTSEEFSWLTAPGDQAVELVACPAHGPGCDCLGEERGARAAEAYPALYEEEARRWAALMSRREEILARDPYRPTPADRQRSMEQSMARQRASTERNRRIAAQDERSAT